MAHKPTAHSKSPRQSAKQDQLDAFRESPAGEFLTTDQGVRVASTDDSLKAGARGPTLLEDFHLREKIMRFDHERIPERVVHARGAGAHGYFQVYKSLAKYTKAAFLQDPAIKTPVFVRFSTVAGSRGSADTVRDVRGFAVKFYTSEGNFDLVGNNMPVFFIQDGIKFPDLIHAVKPNPRKEIPQAASAHDSFWDFISLTPETAHMVMWVMSDRALPRSYRMMEGFGVHTFRLIDGQGKARLVKWHWKPVLGMSSLVWEEAQQINGKDPDFHRRDLWEAIESGNAVEYELGLQVVDEDEALAFGFDLLDATKLLPEEVVPIERVGKLVLDRNPQNFFAEVEQAAFCVGNVVPGIDFTNDPLLQARLFSYLDTQITRLGGPNFAELPINRPIAPVHNNQHDGFARQTMNVGAANYLPNSLGDGFPKPATEQQGGYAHHAERVDGKTTRARSDSFKDHFSQARLFLNSLSPVERGHVTDALSFELGHCERQAVRERVVNAILAHIDAELAAAVAAAVGVEVKTAAKAPAITTGRKGKAVTASPALSMVRGALPSIRTRRIALLAAPGCVGGSLAAVKRALEAEGASVEVVSTALGAVASADGKDPVAVRSLLGVASVMYDAVAVADGEASSATLAANADAVRFVKEAFGHCKAIAAIGHGAAVLTAAGIPAEARSAGVVTGAKPTELGRDFIVAIAQHRHWGREQVRSRPPLGRPPKR
ncbi:MAG: catalase [Planctomycetes bacterium]|nr:catalase [Planctomycetota bacterium]